MTLNPGDVSIQSPADNAIFTVGSDILITATVGVGISAPSQAADVGYDQAVFSDDFNSNSVSLDGAGDFNWYAKTWYTPGLSASDFTLANGILTLKTDYSGYSADLASAAPGHETHTWRHGYFEARLQYNPHGYSADGWPAFWTWSLEHAKGEVGSGNHPELDIMEAWPNPKNSPPGSGVTPITTIHEWYGVGTPDQTANSNNVPTLPAGFDPSTFHTYGCLWTPNRLVWYIDNLPVTTVQTGPGTPYVTLEQQRLYILLGTGKDWPMNVDFVRVWQAGDPVSRVEFFEGSTRLGSSTASPYQFTWSNVPAGTYRLTAKVIQTNGTTTSTPVTIVVSLSLLAPVLDLPAYLPVNAHINATYSGPATHFEWTFTPLEISGPLATKGQMGPSKAPAASLTTPSAQANLASVPLTLGAYEISVTAHGTDGVSPPAKARVTLVAANLDSVRVYPNPWRSDRHSVRSITFDHLMVDTTVKLFTVSGHHVKTLPKSSTSITWDLTNDKGEKVAAGIYLYVIRVNDEKITGQIHVIK